MIDLFAAERNTEEREQRELLQQRGVYLDLLTPPVAPLPVPPVVRNPDVKITYSSAKPDVYKIAEVELLKLKASMRLNKDASEVDQTRLAALIQTLVAEGNAK